MGKRDASPRQGLRRTQWRLAERGTKDQPPSALRGYPSNSPVQRHQLQNVLYLWMVYASVRSRKIVNLTALRNAERHGRRQDESSHKRADLSKTANSLVWSSVDDPLAVVDAWKDRKKTTGAQEYGGACVAMHHLCIVSPGWIQEAGDLHDPKNPRNIALFEHARKWADQTYGEGACISARLDLDEKGGGVVDLVIVPVREMTMRGKTKTIISINKALDEAFGKTKSYSAMQSSWADYAQKNLDSKIERGISKEVTGKEHVHADIIAPALKLQEEVRVRKSDLVRRQKAVRLRENQAAEILERPWWKMSVSSETKKAVLQQVEKNEVYQHFSQRYESIRVQLGDVSSRLTIESRKREKLEGEVRKLQARNSEMSEQLNQLEVVICEAAYEKEIPLTFAEKVRKVFRSAPSLDNVLSVLRPVLNGRAKEERKKDNSPSLKQADR